MKAAFRGFRAGLFCAAAALVGCTSRSDDLGGLMLAVTSDAPLELDRLQITVEKDDQALFARDYKVSSEATLPTTLGIASNGNPTSVITISVVGWSQGVPVDRRDAIVTQVPTDRVALLTVVLSARCSQQVSLVDGQAVSSCADGQTCNPLNGDCKGAAVNATALPSYSLGAEDSASVDFTNVGGAPGVDSGAGGAGGESGGTAGASGAGNEVGPATCGNGVIEGGEACDDGNAESGDGCSSVCAPEGSGWACIRPGEKCLAVPVCGNAQLERGEECDDAQAAPTANDGCSERCQLEAGFACTGTTCVKARCGDGVLSPGEACDDGGKKAGDGCSAVCSVEAGWHCNPEGCASICGDGLVRGAETCDDTNATGGDGCSATCQTEAFKKCTGEPSSCSSNVTCGNSVVDPGEVCDPPNVDGCGGDCQSFTPVLASGVCGNNEIELGETCDPPSPGAGCTSACAVEAGWSCFAMGVCARNPFCGDSKLDLAQGETCDPPNVGQGCSAACQQEAGWSCVGSPSVCNKPVCGNGKLEPGEECDDGGSFNGDGCSAGCKRESGFICPVAGSSCRYECGNGKLNPGEQCDDGNKDNGDGCSASCKVELSFTCPTVGSPCVPTVCGDGIQAPSEGCDDGGRVAGDTCSPSCAKEPTVTVGPSPTVNVGHGDGFIDGAEECDDGNIIGGDGCSSIGLVESPGWSCVTKVALLPATGLQVTLRDFKAGSAISGDGQTDFEYKQLGQVAGLVGAACTSLNQGSCGRLNAQGKPSLTGTNNQATSGITNAASFGLWYANDNAGGVKNHLGNVIATPLKFTNDIALTRLGNSATYVYDSGALYFPLDGKGYGSIGSEAPSCGGGVRDVSGSCSACAGACAAHNFSFTTEARFVFQYLGGEIINFKGDDDVWIFVNGRLAVDMGGLHQALTGQVVLGDDGPTGDSDCSAQGVTVAPPDPAAGCYTQAEKDDSTDSRFALTKGGVYEIAIFQAERHTSASNFKLSLTGFMAPRSYCGPSTCGDGDIAGAEACDKGPGNNVDGKSGACRADCSAFAYCGDKIQQDLEACDDGVNSTLYGSGCAPSCVTPPSCGDSVVQAAFGEECDNGAAGNHGAYGGCTAQCKLGPHCGDGFTQAPEACDNGTDNGKTYGATSCGYDCQPGPHCGDHIKNGSEECDDGDQNGALDDHCDIGCALKPFCGDGIKQVGETCDVAQFASASEYLGCTDQCALGPHCGDGGGPDPEEECDLGAAKNKGGYDGCTATCALGPRCGDGIVQAPEACDNGFNEDAYDDPATPGPECAHGCTAPPHCGDGAVQAGFEQCDNGDKNADDAYLGCTTDCHFGPFCGDGTTDMGEGETCDNGADNVAYSAAEGACALDCRPAPFCGDHIRNGPEPCDAGPAGSEHCSPSCQAR